jgi:serine/threonine-protein kinase
VIAIWTYQDASALLVYTDFKGYERYTLWHAPNAHQMNYEDPGELNHMLYTLSMEVPDQLDRVLSKKFRPKSTA